MQIYGHNGKNKLNKIFICELRYIVEHSEFHNKIRFSQSGGMKILPRYVATWSAPYIIAVLLSLVHDFHSAPVREASVSG